MVDVVAVQRSLPVSVWPSTIDDVTVKVVAPAAVAARTRAIRAGAAFRIIVICSSFLALPAARSGKIPSRRHRLVFAVLRLCS